MSETLISTLPLTERARLFKSFKASAPDASRIPVVVEPSHRSKTIKIVSKLLMKQKHTIHDVMNAMRKVLNLDKDEAMFIIGEGGRILQPTVRLRDIAKGEGEDGFLYLKYQEYKSFGGRF